VVCWRNDGVLQRAKVLVDAEVELPEEGLVAGPERRHCPLPGLLLRGEALVAQQQWGEDLGHPVEAAGGGGGGGGGGEVLGWLLSWSFMCFMDRRHTNRRRHCHFLQLHRPGTASHGDVIVIVKATLAGL
jgi:hypothetical protein